jgi:serine/threonine protein kinase
LYLKTAHLELWATLLRRTVNFIHKLNNVVKFEEPVVKIYTAEIINVLETIHYNNVMHRDLKPENILLTKDYHLKVVSIIYFYSRYYIILLANILK